MLSNLWEQIVKEVIAWFKRIWFEAKLKANLDMIEIQNRIESELEREKEAEPIYIEHPIDPVLQTGDSQLLGGAMELKAPWYNNDLGSEQPGGEAKAPGVADSN